MKKAYLGLGANLGDAAGNIKKAIAAINKIPRTQLIKASSLYKSAPFEATGPDFINAVIEIKTQLTPQELLKQTQQIENQAGRQRPWKNAPRTLDIDLLIYENQIINEPNLKIPHPEMRKRAFVLLPLSEIAPQLVGELEINQLKTQAISRLI